jgi:DNA-binding response OmpR family regulator
MSQATVLVVDDDSDARALLELALSAEGLTVQTAVNGADALRVARRSRPDVILLDLAMPIMDGFAFREAQLVDPALAAIPVICVSGRHDVEHAVRRLQMAACVPKPFCLTEVIRRVHEVLAGSFSPPEAAST